MAAKKKTSATASNLVILALLIAEVYVLVWAEVL